MGVGAAQNNQSDLLQDAFAMDEASRASRVRFQPLWGPAKAQKLVQTFQPFDPVPGRQTRPQPRSTRWYLIAVRERLTWCCWKLLITNDRGQPLSRRRLRHFAIEPRGT